MKRVFHWIDRIMRLDEVLASAALFAIFLVAISNIFMRYIFNTPLAWTEEVLQLLMVWATFLGASALVRRNEHVLIDMLSENLPASLARWNDRLFNVGMVLIAAIVLGYWGLQLLPYSNFRSTPMLQIPYMWIHVAIPVSAVIMAYHCLVRLARDT